MDKQAIYKEAMNNNKAIIRSIDGQLIVVSKGNIIALNTDENSVFLSFYDCSTNTAEKLQLSKQEFLKVQQEIKNHKIKTDSLR